jgi:hypothetical protein
MLAVAAACCVAFAATTAIAKLPADAATGTLDGKLTDWHSIPLGQASVVVRNLSTGAVVHGVTAKNGSYHFTGLGPGEYRLEADVPQLGKGTVEGILVSAGHSTRVQAALVMNLTDLPGQTDPIEADVHELDPVTPAVTTMIPSDELNAVPVSSRNWQELAAITPAANPVSRGINGGQIGAGVDSDSGNEPLGQSLSMEGGSGLQTASSIDGMATTPAFHNEGDRPSRATESVGTSAIEAMQARTGNASADADSALGGAMNLVTEHGHNGLHGQAFYLNRQSLWGAQNPFTQRIEETAPAEGVDIAKFTPEPYSPANSRQTMGLGIGRQLKRDKLFWFAALDGLLSSDPAVATVRHPANFFIEPSQAELTVLAALLNLPGSDPWDEGAAAYSSKLEQLTGLLGEVPHTTGQWQAFGRVDSSLDERQHVSVEGQTASENAPGGGLSRSSETYGSHSFGNSQASDDWGLFKLDSFVTANLLNAAAAQFRRHVQSDTAQAPSAFEAPLANNAWGQSPEIIADSRYGFILGKPARLGGAGTSRNPDERVLAAQDMLSWVRGAHLVKAGASFEHTSDAIDTLTNQTGTYSYANVLNFLTDESSISSNLGIAGGVNAPQQNCDWTGKIQQFPMEPTPLSAHIPAMPGIRSASVPQTGTSAPTIWQPSSPNNGNLRIT